MEEVCGYDRAQLLEDYDLTVRMKSRGYEVALAEKAVASTIVPSSFGQLWRQRVRWQYGGLTVVARHRRVLTAVFPDMLAHALTLALLLSILSSLIWHEAGNGEAELITVMRAVSIAMSVVFYVIQLLFMMMADGGKDWKDVALRMLLIPEFLYSFILSLVLFGSYLFFLYMQVRNAFLPARRTAGVQKLFFTADRIFAYAGYTTKWGTK
jgi:cellulose synthase/poly-beta-1,6-N-acetylglucosamine synthase-like glycosyltransferase